ncbi:MAG: 3-dehydroquinate synthase [Oscillospiraceae bacterium]|jgi:3-dehydroquinate synthase|nr:3-dehydroquinate synthase [Oscillospiraceae bacterium]
MKTVTVPVSKKYDVLIGRDILRNIGGYALKTTAPCNAAIITDDIVDDLYAGVVEKSLKDSGFNVVKYVLANGECSKNMDSFSSVLEFLAQSEMSRSDIIIALGGGVVGDIAGFCASVYLRGIRFIQVPTTFLSAIDSSVGGKTGVNLLAGKNLAGSFWQPDLVVCDYLTLDTLSPSTFADGISEAIKYGVISSKNLFNTLKQVRFNDIMEDIITQCVTIKRDIVIQDEFDTGARQLLNFGHTIGHCIEKLSGFKITHGHAVAIGMSVITKASFNAGICSQDLYDQLTRALSANNLPVTCDFDANELYKTAISDKKRKADKITLIVPKEIGRCELYELGVGSLLDFITLGL